MPIHNLNHVNMFLQVIASGSISSAARILRKSHTAVSSAVSNLEIDLCVELVRRDGYKVEPTEQALRLIPYMRSLLNYQQLIGDIAFNLNKGPRNLRVLLDTAIPPSFCDTVSSVLLDDFNMVSLIRTSPADSLATIKQDNAEIDIAITIDEELKISRFNQCVLGYTKAFVVAHPQHPLCNASLHSIASLANYRQISLGSRSGQHSNLLRPVSDKVLFVENFDDMLRLVEAGVGMGHRAALFRRGTPAQRYPGSPQRTLRTGRHRHQGVLLLQHRAGIRAQLPALSRKRPPAPARTGPPAFRRCAGLATEHRRNGAAPLRPEGARVPPARRTRVERSPADAGRGW